MSITTRQDPPAGFAREDIDAIDRVDFGGLCYADSDTGIGNAHSYGTGFPPGVTAASTFNRELIRARGFAIAQEVKVKRFHAVLGPVLAFARTVGGGTNFEGFGNDPYLLGVAGNIDSKTFHEVYLWPFAETMRASPAYVMMSYPFVNNSEASQNACLMKKLEFVKKPHPYPQIDYTEGVSIDYRGFERNGKSTRFWFGHGLSCSNFTYSKLSIKKHTELGEAIKTPLAYVADAPGGDARMYDLAVTVSLNIHDDGAYDGTEIPQLYLQLPKEAKKKKNPTKVIRGFESVQIRNGEIQTVYLYLTRKDISYWNTVKRTWVTSTGEFVIFVGASSNDVRLKGSFTV